MSWLLSTLLLFAQPAEYLDQLQKGAGCKTCAKFRADSEERNLLLFISFSVPVSTWIDLSLDLAKTEGVFVVRGLPENSFEAFAKNILKLRQAGVMAPIYLDPGLFEQYEIDAVPTLVLREKGKFDKVAGNLRLEAALEKIKADGETQACAECFLKQLRGVE